MAPIQVLLAAEPGRAARCLTKPGSHRLLQVGTLVLERVLANTVIRWYPQMHLTGQEVPLAA